ncbi:RDD family protein [Actinoallomurus spadix]|uniref:RDD domain-containing protein n=1 Tax=Actinoallomurus spadix TaxID=79912 RepID=A0ABN0VX56_9ACTN|nr:RDD family protein [Actinoallomurus spadix]MCO5985935.1 RDD family protein [Actinoallomurus spadix]
MSGAAGLDGDDAAVPADPREDDVPEAPAQDEWAAPGGSPPEQPGPHPRPYGLPPGQPYAAAPGPYGGPPPGPYGAPGQGWHGAPPAGPPPYPPGRPHPAYGPPAPMDPTLAEWWQRLVARIVDGLILLVVTAPLLIWYFSWYLHKIRDVLPSDPEGEEPPIGRLLHVEVRLMGYSLLVGLVSALIAFGYEAVATARWGRTLGKRVMHIKVVALADRGAISGGTAVKRAAIYTLAPQVPSAGGLFALLNVLWLLWDKPYRQCLHDKIAHTVVVKTRL